MKSVRENGGVSRGLKELIERAVCKQVNYLYHIRGCGGAAQWQECCEVSSKTVLMRLAREQIVGIPKIIELLLDSWHISRALAIARRPKDALFCPKKITFETVEAYFSLAADADASNLVMRKNAARRCLK